MTKRQADCIVWASVMNVVGCRNCKSSGDCGKQEVKQAEMLYGYDVAERSTVLNNFVIIVYDIIVSVYIDT